MAISDDERARVPSGLLAVAHVRVGENDDDALEGPLAGTWTCPPGTPWSGLPAVDFSERLGARQMAGDTGHRRFEGEFTLIC
jgi:hypothetical protein